VALGQRRHPPSSHLTIGKHGNPDAVCLGSKRTARNVNPQREEEDPRSEGRPPKGNGNPSPGG